MDASNQTRARYLPQLSDHGLRELPVYSKQCRRVVVQNRDVLIDRSLPTGSTQAVNNRAHGCWKKRSFDFSH